MISLITLKIKTIESVHQMMTTMFGIVGKMMTPAISHTHIPQPLNLNIINYYSNQYHTKGNTHEK